MSETTFFKNSFEKVKLLVDIGVNLSHQRFANDTREVLTYARENGVRKLVITGTSITESIRMVELLQKHSAEFPGMLYGTVGIHPHSASEFSSASIAELRSLSVHSNVVAIGETGLDFYRDLASREMQVRCFEAHLGLASELGLPLFMHEREASSLQIDILKNHRNNFNKGVIHCFTGDRKTLHQYLDMDLHIGVTGWVCDPRRGKPLQDLIAEIPLNRLMIETDSPYLLPRNMAFPPKDGRNEPSFLPWVVSGISACRTESQSEIVKQTGQTATKFFGLH